MRRPVSERVRVALALAVGLALTVAVLLYLRTDPPPYTPRPPAELASPFLPPGAVGGLLPEVSLRNRQGPVDSRRLRPGVVFLVADDCACVEQIRQVVAEAAPFRLVTYVVHAGSDPSVAETLAAQAGGAAAGFADEQGVLATAYRLHTKAAVVLVRRDGVVTQVVAAVAPSLRLASSFAGLVA